MPPAVQWRSAWAWRWPQRKAKRSGDRPETAIAETAIGVGGEEGRDLDSILAGALNLGVIAGGPQAAASVVTGGNGGQRQASSIRFRLLVFAASVASTVASL